MKIAVEIFASYMHSKTQEGSEVVKRMLSRNQMMKQNFLAGTVGAKTVT